MLLARPIDQLRGIGVRSDDLRMRGEGRDKSRKHEARKDARRMTRRVRHMVILSGSRWGIRCSQATAAACGPRGARMAGGYTGGRASAIVAGGAARRGVVEAKRVA